LQCAASKGPWRSTKLRRLPSLQHTHSIGTDGLTDDAATHSLLQALAAAGDLYATMQQDVLGQPPHAPPTEAPQAPTLPRYVRHLRPPHLNEEYEAQLHEEMRCSDHLRASPPARRPRARAGRAAS